MFIRVSDIGRIEEIVDTSPKFAEYYPDHVWVDEVSVNFDDHYYSEGSIHSRPDPAPLSLPSSSSIKADGVEVFAVGNIPEGTFVRIDGPIEDEWTEDSGTCEISVNVPGKYQLTFESWPCKPIEVIFNAS